MDPFTLPASTYESPSRLARKQTLNTIMEDEVKFQRRNVPGAHMDQPRRRNSMTNSSSRCSSPTPSLTSSISSYYKYPPAKKEFDDLYDASDASDSEGEWESKLQRPRSQSMLFDESRPMSWASSSTSSRNRYPSLVIPSPRNWPTIHNVPYSKTSAVPPTPANLVISPEALKLLSPSFLPTSSAPPSLDGSLTSDQIATISSPPTPDLHFDKNSWSGRVEVSEQGSDLQDDASSAEVQTIEIEANGRPTWNQPSLQINTNTDGGVQLPAGALDILRHLSYEATLEQADPFEEMKEVSMKHARRSSADMTPASAISGYSFSEMSVPSPGGFFSSLEGNARHTWTGYGMEPESAAPPSSTTAEHFYNAPWNTRRTIEQVLEVDDNGTEGPPTAIRLPAVASPMAAAHSQARQNSDSDIVIEEIDANKLVKDFDEDYEKEIWQCAESTLDRTSLWLSAQTTYMSSLRETDSATTASVGETLSSRRTSKHIRQLSLDSPMKKAVKFLESQLEKPDGKIDTPSKSDPLFYQAFQHMSNSSSPTDSFVHRHARYESIQACRASLAQHHLNQLLGNYKTTTTDRPAPMRPISMMPGKGEDAQQTPEQKVIAQVERERQAVEQVTPAMWIIEAIRYLNGGRLLNSPANTILANAPPLELSNLPSHIRVLDLGGQAQCDWAWHCARDFPNVKTYTATSDRRNTDINLRGPSNHRLVSVKHLWALPFPTNHFDVISARSLFTFLQTQKPLGETIDQYDLCLRECLRVLKPGGYLEFFILDSEIVQAGPLGAASSVEFGYNLKARGYDPHPTKSWLGRIRKAGLTDIKRAWMFLPMGTVQTDSPRSPPETPPPHVSMYEDSLATTEAVRGPVGSKADAAEISGLVGSWAWEQWLLKLEMEMGKGKLVEGVGAVLEEGKMTGAGWRCLSGWARKPM